MSLSEVEKAFLDEWNLTESFYYGFFSKSKGKLIGGHILSFADPPRGLLDNGNRISESIQAIVVSGSPRLGNAVIALIHAITLARRLSVRRISCPGFIFDPTAPSSVFGVSIGAMHPIDVNLLKGSFLFSKNMGALLSRDSLSKVRSSATPGILRLLGLDIHDVQAQSENELTIHIRSGDIFEVAKPNIRYGQPPLAFYLRVISSEAWSKIHLVFENEANPVISSLKRWLRKRKIPFVTYSQEPLEDLRTCFEAQNFVMSKGTFAWPVLSSSKNLKRLWSFENSAPDWIAEQGLDHVRLREKSGIYRKFVLRQWQNTRLQKMLMLRLPQNLIE